MPLPLRGQRYADKISGDFPATVAAQIHSWSFENVIAFYDSWDERLTPEQAALLGCCDRYYLLTRLCKRQDAVHPWLYARCREVEANPDGYLDLWARYHYKSSIITFAGSIQEILTDPEVTIAIFAATNKVAKPFLRWIKEEFEINERLKSLYPDVLWQFPRKEAPVWSMQDGIVVRRQGNPKEPTCNGYGLIDGMPTGGHFQILNYDDLVTLELVSNEEMQKKTTMRWEMSDNLGVGAATRKRMAGTRYSYGDTYGVIIERKSVKVRLYPATKPVRPGMPATLDGEPVFMTQEHWDKVKRDQRATIAAQMLQNPLAGSEATFQASTLRPFHIRPRTLNVYIMGDPSMGRGASSDRTAMVAVGYDAAKNFYLLDGYCHRMNLSERWKALKNLYLRWTAGPNSVGVKFVKVGYERYGMQSDIEHFNLMMEIKDEPIFQINELSWVREGLQSKKARVGRLEPDFANNKFRLPAKVWHPDVTWWIDKLGKEHIGEMPNDVRLDGGVEKVGPRACFWSVNEETNEIEYRPIPRTATGLLSESKEEREAKANGEKFRIIEPIRRRDEDGNMYDLTRMFFEEFKFFPFASHDDLVDAVSRVHDMEAVPPQILDERLLALPNYPD